MIDTPTCYDLLNWEDSDKYIPVDSFSEDSWRHGSNIKEVFRRLSDETYWAAYYQKSGDGEYNGLRDGDATIERVELLYKQTAYYTKWVPPIE